MLETEIDEISSVTISNVYPNPVQDNINVSVLINEEQFVNINLVDASGAFITNVYSGNLLKGGHRFSFNISELNNELSSGTYYIMLQSDHSLEAYPVIIQK